MEDIEAMIADLHQRAQEITQRRLQQVQEDEASLKTEIDRLTLHSCCGSRDPAPSLEEIKERNKSLQKAREKSCAYTISLQSGHNSNMNDAISEEYYNRELKYLHETNEKCYEEIRQLKAQLVSQEALQEKVNNYEGEINYLRKVGEENKEKMMNMQIEFDEKFRICKLNHKAKISVLNDRITELERVRDTLNIELGAAQAEIRSLQFSLKPEATELHNCIEIPVKAVTDSEQNLLTGGSRPTTPLLLTRKSPTMDQGVQVNQLGLTPIKKDTKERQNTDGTLQNSRLQIGIERPLRTLPNQQYRQKYRQQYSQQRDRQGGQDRSQNAVQRNQQNAATQQSQQMQPLPQRLPQQRGGWGNRTGARRSRARGGGSGNAGGGMGRQQVGTPTVKGKTLKFDSEYDFEQANTEFEELRSQLAKTKIADSEPVVAGDGKANGDAEKKDDSGNETGIGEGETEEEHEVYYDRSKSFFDNISCEAVERSKGRSQRTDWRTERKLNSETFGVASARRGGFRGRGWYNRGGYRGQYRNNFRGLGSGAIGSNRNRNSSASVQQTPAPIANSTPPRAVTVQSN